MRRGVGTQGPWSEGRSSIVAPRPGPGVERRRPLEHGVHGRRLQQLRAAGQEVRDEDIAQLSPRGFKHLNFLGRHSFTAPPVGALRQLRDPSEPEDEDDNYHPIQVPIGPDR
jgi:hypothetical protein